MKINIKHKNKIVGYIKFHWQPVWRPGRNIWVDFVWISKKHRRQGYATKLFSMLEEKYHPLWIDLWTGLKCEKDQSWKLYKKLGFKQYVNLKDYYEEGVGSRYFAKRLNHEKR
jgi:ribosomal protein S18 acetylase RimI-like enzyme